MRIIICISNDNNTWGWFLCFSIALNIGSESLSAKALVSLNSCIFRFLRGCAILRHMIQRFTNQQRTIHAWIIQNGLNYEEENY